MSAPEQASGSSGSGSSNGADAVVDTTIRLGKGKSCMLCRTKKRKCDGKQPACSQCARSGIEECDFPGFKRRSMIKILEERAEELMGQIKVAESRKTIEPRASTRGSTGVGSSRLSISYTHPRSDDALDVRWNSTTTTTPQAVYLPQSAMPDYLLGRMQSAAASGSSMVLFNVPKPLGGWDGVSEPPSGLQDTLAAVLTQPRCRCALPALPDPRTCPDPSMRNSLFLLACHFHGGIMTQLEPIFLRRLRGSLFPTNDEHVSQLDFIEASTHLTSYYFLVGRMREATLSCSVTVGFAQSCGLHLIAPPLWGAETSSKLGGPVRTWLELGRRIKVWWTIFPLSRWASTFTRSGRPSTREDDDQIKTVWHLPQECYEEGRVPEDDFNSVSSLYALESGAALVSQDSPETIRSKIVILLERATTLGERAPEETNNCDPSDPFWLDFYCTDNALAAFIWSLPPLQRETQGLIGPDVSPTELVPELTFGHVMAYGAVIQLHNPLAKAGHDESRQKCFQAARGVMRVARLILAFKHTMSVVLSVTWFVAFQVYSRELNKVTEEARNPPMISYRDSSAPGAGDLISDMTVLLTLMRRLAEIYPVVSPQVTELQEWYDKHCKIDARYSLS